MERSEQPLFLVLVDLLVERSRSAAEKIKAHLSPHPKYLLDRAYFGIYLGVSPWTLSNNNALISLMNNILPI
jgi:hypothetical protein